MTPRHPNRPDRGRLLEGILETVTSIDRTVDEILDRLTDYAAGLEASRDWHEHGYDLRTGCDYEPD